MATAEEEAYDGAFCKVPNSKPQASHLITSQSHLQTQWLILNTPVVDQDAQAQHQQKLLEALHLPKAAIMNSLQFWVFMRAFENSVANSSLSDRATLTRLLQYCRGPAERVIHHCTVTDPRDGYRKAISLLKERFNSSYVIGMRGLTR
ncbi:hypothetical protein HOLleu_05824 [Holothuria leucospilota]|uniref:Uncharacterized protein n=1 Tax=Holothuria leucospilota TaxID=206669 RepID=A0A9Q1HJ68_HOLLE|nr:hypothetical protein HOLleu_05824 [Holothuria leucospilota]